MSESKIQTLERLRTKYGAGIAVTPKEEASAVLTDSAFVVESAETSRLFISTPASEVAQAERPGLYLRGRLVGADEPNRNGAYWTKGDLEFGLPTVANGPLNWIHQTTEVIGTLISPWLIDASENEWTDYQYRTKNKQAFIETNAVVWDWVQPEKAELLRQALADDQAWISMECVSEAVQCGECEAIVSWEQYLNDQVCVHVREHSAYRRFMNPTFLGAGVIVPPFQPGWSKADLVEVASKGEYASAMEIACARSSISEEQAASMVAAILEYSRK